MNAFFAVLEEEKTPKSGTQTEAPVMTPLSSAATDACVTTPKSGTIKENVLVMPMPIAVIENELVIPASGAETGSTRVNAEEDTPRTTVNSAVSECYTRETVGGKTEVQQLTASPSSQQEPDAKLGDRLQFERKQELMEAVVARFPRNEDARLSEFLDVQNDQAAEACQANAFDRKAPQGGGVALLRRREKVKKALREVLTWRMK
jgi:hypothetical protein